MKKFLQTVFIFLVGCQFADAQQKPQYTQYVFNNLLINPAVTGIENYIDAKAGYRSQWTGLQGAPVTSYLTVSAPLGSDFVNGDATEMPAGGAENPYSRLYTQNYEAAAPHHGIGFMIISDQAGPIQTTNIDATYAYHLGLTSTLNLAVGVAAGFNHISLNTSLITLENPLDPAISNGDNSQWKPDLTVGAWAYSSNYYFGISAQQILPQNLYFSTSNDYSQTKTVPQYLITGGVKLFLSDDLTLMPSTLVKIIKPLPIVFDINTKLAFRDVFWIGAAYRKDDSFAGMVGFNLSNLINISYAYDHTTSALNTVSNGTHEIVLGIMLNSRYKVPSHSF